MKYCKKPDCNNPVFGGGYCKFHQYMRGTNKIRPKSKKRIKEDIVYKNVKTEKQAELEAEGKYVCVFCGEPFTCKPDWHHVLGRDGNLMVDKKHLFPAHYTCHILKYHGSPISKLKKEPWWNRYLQWCKEFDYELYQKELRKLDRECQ